MNYLVYLGISAADQIADELSGGVSTEDELLMKYLIYLPQVRLLINYLVYLHQITDELPGISTVDQVIDELLVYLLYARLWMNYLVYLLQTGLLMNYLVVYVLKMSY